jgi:3-hydroxyisobutyrate/3-hydroxypropionate dehydrogenase
MAKNLQSKLSPSDSVRLFDINKDAMHRLAEDMRTSQAGGAVIELAENIAEVAKDAVGITFYRFYPTFPSSTVSFL